MAADVPMYDIVEFNVFPSSSGLVSMMAATSVETKKKRRTTATDSSVLWTETDVGGDVVGLDNGRWRRK